MTGDIVSLIALPAVLSKVARIFFHVDQLKLAPNMYFQSRVGCLDSTPQPRSLSIPFQTLQDCPSVTAPPYY
ncbi:MAG: hypothetical protein IPP42_01155 [Saprospiraceae bacterium]|nr:hypothetical protein [Saprospiraceae bacterium]